MKKTKNYAMPYPEQDDYFNVEDFQDMMVSVDDLMKKLSDSGAQISSDAEHLYNQTKAQMDNIQKRMNAFTALRDGSTTGDAELKDIRVAYDGKEYGNAGEAVREQASDIHKALFGAGASIWSKAKSESKKYVVETKGICILNERFTAAGVVTKISRGTFAENESTLNLDRECSAYIVEFEKNPGTVYVPSAETIKIVSTMKIIFEANGNARCWIPVEKGQYLAVDSTATAYTSESNHVPYMLYDQANKTLECRGFGSTGSIEPVDPYSLALEYKLEYDMDDTGLVKQIDANREAAVSLKEDIGNFKIIEHSLNVYPNSETDLQVEPNTDYEILIANKKNTDITVLIRTRKKDKSASNNYTFSIKANETRIAHISTINDEYYIRIGEQAKDYEYHFAIKKVTDINGMKTDIDGMKNDINGMKTDIDGNIGTIINLGNVGSSIGNKIMYYDSTKVAKTDFIYANAQIKVADGYSIRGVYVYDKNNILLSVPVDNTQVGGNAINNYNVNGIGVNNATKYVVTIKKVDESELSNFSNILRIVKPSSLREDLDNITETIYGDNFLKTLETVKTESYYANYAWFIPLNLYSQGDTMLFYFPTLSDGTYNTYLCDESKTAVQDINVVVKEHYSTVVYPKFGKQYAYLRMYAKKSSDVCYIKKMSSTILSTIDGFTQKNIHSMLVDNTGNTDVSHDVQMLINSMESDGEVEIYFPKGKYLFSNTIKHKKGNVTFRCAKGAEIIVNSSPIYTPFEIAGANVLPYSLGSFKIIGGCWTTSRTFGETGNPISTGFQVTKMERVELIDAIFDELTQSNHLFDISGSKNVFIKGCTFRGMYFNPSQKPIGRDGNFEMIQIDLASGINLSICTENGHNECTKNVVIKDCVFEPSGKDNCYLYRPVGIHFGGTLINNVVDWYDNIKIENNIFHNVLGRAIEVSCARNVSVKRNIFKQETEIIDGIIKCGSVRWGNTATWATFNGISDKQRYNCMNISILDNILSCSVDSDEMFIDAFPVLDTSSMYVNSSGSPLTKMAKNVTIKGNTGDLNIRANNIYMLNINNNDVPNVYVDNNS